MQPPVEFGRVYPDRRTGSASDPHRGQLAAIDPSATVLTETRRRSATSGTVRRGRAGS
jgi:hypothetical protein